MNHGNGISHPVIFKRVSLRPGSFDDAFKGIGEGKLNIEVPEDGFEEIKELLRMFIETMKKDISALHEIHGSMKGMVNENNAGHARRREAILKDIENLNIYAEVRGMPNEGRQR